MISDTLSYNTLRRTSFLVNEIFEDKEAIEALFEKLQKTPPNKIPFLFPGTGPNAKGESIFENIMSSQE